VNFEERKTYISEFNKWCSANEAAIKYLVKGEAAVVPTYVTVTVSGYTPYDVPLVDLSYREDRHDGYKSLVDLEDVRIDHPTTIPYSTTETARQRDLLLKLLREGAEVVSALEAACDNAGNGDLVEVRDWWRKADAFLADCNPTTKGDE
jgi:hypothetical protein